MAVIAPRIMRGFTLVANDDVNLALSIEELALPMLEETVETFQPGGSDGEVEIAGLGTKALTLGMKVKGVAAGINAMFAGEPGTRRTWTGKVLVVDEETGEEHEHAIDVVGRLTKIGPAAHQGGKVNGYDYEVKSIWTYTEYWNGQVLHRFSLKTGGWDIQNFNQMNSHRRSFLFS